jgi:uncharacterized protein YciI
MRTLALPIALVFAALVAVRAQQPAAPAAAPATPAPPKAGNYLAIYREGPAFKKDVPPQEQLREHGRYLVGLSQKQQLKLGGAFGDVTGGAIMFEAENDAAAKAIMDGDPAVVAKTYVYELHPWRLVDFEAIAKRMQAAPAPR